MRQNEKAHRDSNNNPLRIFKPLHLYFHSELEELQRFMKAKKNTKGLKLIEPEIKIREKESAIIEKQARKEFLKQMRNPEYIQDWGK